MDGAEILGAEDVGEESWNGCKTTAVHGEDQKKACEEQRPISRGRQCRNPQEHEKLNDEKYGIGIPPSDIVGSRGPQKSSAGIEQADDRHNDGSLSGGL